MTLFWILGIALAVVAAVLVAWPLLRAPKEQSLSLLELNAQVFRDRLAELEKDREAGRIEAEEYDQLKIELERNLLNLSDSHNTAQVPARVKPLFAVAVLAIPALSAAFYLFFQFNQNVPDWWVTEKKMQPIIEQVIAGKVPDAKVDHDLREFVLGLQRHLQDDPSNAEGWFMLGMSYLQANMPEQAKLGFERAWRLRPDWTEATLAYAQTLIVTNNGTLNPQSKAILQSVLAKHPSHEGALLLLGMGAYRAQDFSTAAAALGQFKAGRSEGLSNSNVFAQIDEALAESEAALARLADKNAPVQVEAAKIIVSVRVDKSLMAQVNPDDVVFVFARALNGPPMPLAAVRKSAHELPIQVELSDAQAMLPNMKLSDFNEVVVSARVSKEGQPQAVSGDLEAVGTPLRMDGKSHRVELLIQSVRP